MNGVKRMAGLFSGNDKLLVCYIIVILCVAFGLLKYWDKRMQNEHRGVRLARSCQVNVKQIDGAIQQWVLEYKKVTTDTYSLADPTLLSYLKGSVLPVCPSGGHYTAGTNISDLPKCNIPGHTL